MEQNTIQWLGSPSCLRGSFAFYKSVGCCRDQTGGPSQVWRLGEFYYVRCGPQEPVCIAEVTLLWEDRAQRHLLASSRLYFLPEDTPKGRSREHGEDEVLSVSKKVVVRVEDLVRWTCPEPPVLRGGRGGSGRPNGTNGHHRPTNTTTVPAPLTDRQAPLTDRQANDGSGETWGVKVLSYPQYCRYRSLQRRIQEGPGGPGVRDPHLLALGGLRVAQHNTRVLYCRDTFHHPTLDSNTSVLTQLGCTSLSLKGRPRKTRRDSKGLESQTLHQSDSWIDKMKENVMGSVEMNWEGGWLPHPEEQLFLDQLFLFMERRGSTISKVPNLGFKKINLFLMYSVVKRLGGYERVTSQRLWKVVYNELGGCPGSTSAATCTRRHYERLMLPYEEHILKGGGEAELQLPASSGGPRTRGRKRRVLVNGRGGGGVEAKEREKKTVTPITPPAVSPDGVVVVKRGRGRPPGRRNQATLLAEAKAKQAFLLAEARAAALSNQAKPDQAKLLTQAKPDQAKLLTQAKVGTLPPPARPIRSNAAKPGPALGVHPLQDSFLQSLAGFQELNRANMPLTPDLSPLSPPFLPHPLSLLPKPEREPGDSPQCLSAALPRPERHTEGGSLGGFTPTRGLCPLDLFRTCLGQDSPPLTPQDPAPQQPTTPPLQLQTGSSDSPQPHPCSCCRLDEGLQRGGGGREGRIRPALPPLRVLPLDVACRLQVRQLMCTPLGAAQLHSFTKRLSEALAQDLRKPHPPAATATPPPEQALPLNLSKRSASKHHVSDNTTEAEMAAGDELDEEPTSLPAKRPRVGPHPGEEAEAEDLSLGRSSSRGGLQLVLEAQVEDAQEGPADLSSPNRARAFPMELPQRSPTILGEADPPPLPCQGKVEEDLSESSSLKVEREEVDHTIRTEQEREEQAETVKVEDRENDGVEEGETVKMEHDEEERMEVECQLEKVDGEEEGNETVQVEECKNEGEKEEVGRSVGLLDGSFGGQQVLLDDDDDEKMECEASVKGQASSLLPQPLGLDLAQEQASPVPSQPLALDQPSPVLPQPAVQALDQPSPISPQPAVLALEQASPVLPQPTSLALPSPVSPQPLALDQPSPVLPQPTALSLDQSSPVQPQPLALDQPSPVLPQPTALSLDPSSPVPPQTTALPLASPSPIPVPPQPTALPLLLAPALDQQSCLDTCTEARLLHTDS